MAGETAGIVPGLWSGRYVGLPWVDNGEDWLGVYCWGLVRLVLREERGRNIRHPSEMPAGAARVTAAHYQAVRELVLNEVRLVTAPAPWQDFDLVEIEIRGPGPDHIGIVAGDTLLHATRGIGSHRTPLHRLRPGSIKGAWRLAPDEAPRHG